MDRIMPERQKYSAEGGRRRVFWRVVKGFFLTVFWTVVALVLLTIGSATTAVKLLTPERLTPLVNYCASAYLRADVKATRVELTFWHTFPRLTLEVDSLSVVSRSLAPLTDTERASLPAGADTLMTVRGFAGGVNLAQLPLGRIALYDVVIDRPMINLVSVNDSVSNFNIVSPTEPDTTTAPVIIPDFSIDRFAIVNAETFSYRSLADSLAGSVTLDRVELGGKGAPVYDVELRGDLGSPLLKEYNFEKVVMGLDGSVFWDKKHPHRIGFKNFVVDVDEIKANIDTDIDFADSLTVRMFDFRLSPVDVQSLAAHAPVAYAKAVKPLRTDMVIELRGRLTSPYCLTDTSAVPSFEARLTIPDCRVDYGRARFKRFGADVAVSFDGLNPDKSVIDLKRLVVEGPATSISAGGKATSLLSDPAVDFSMKADMVLDRLPAELKSLIPAVVSGRLHADLSVKGRKSYLSRNGFHRLKVDGSLRGADLDVSMPESDLKAWLRNVVVEFGTSKSFVRDDHRVDSLLTASVKIDTASVDADGMEIALAGFAAGVGSANRRESVDTAAINPFGGAVRIGRLSVMSPADSSRLRLRDFACRGSLQRFEGERRIPQLALNMTARRISAGNPRSRYSLRESDIDVIAHIKPKKKMGAKTQAVYDSIASLHPELSADSLLTLARAERKRQHAARDSVDVGSSDKEVVEFGLDSKMKELLRRWGVHGTVKAKSGRVFTPYFPLRNKLNDIDIEFSTDSLVLRDVKYKVGQSDFLINGTVSNLRRAMTSRRHVPIEIDFNLQSDTINVNELVRAMFAGGAYADRLTSDRPVLDLDKIDDDAALEKAISAESDTISGPFLVPHNIKASLKMRARNIIYADMLLKLFRGVIDVYDGAINLNRLSARTDLGSIDLSALYSAPDCKRMEFGFGVKIKDFHIDRFLTMFPSIDTIMPMLKDISGIVNADIAATTNIDTLMNFVVPTLRAAIKVEGDSLVLLDAETFRMLSKWLFFKDKKHNMINHMSVEAVVENSQLELFPFMFDIDRYRLGVMGHNDLSLNYDYHISVLKSPLPFKFGINLRGTPDDMKIRMGGAKFKENMVVERREIVDTTRVNLIKQMSAVFRRGVTAARLGRLNIGDGGQAPVLPAEADTLSRSDSLMLIKEGLLEAPPSLMPDTTAIEKKKSKRKRR